MQRGHSFKVVGQLDPAPLLARLAARPDLWKTGPRESFDGSPHAQAQSIMVRWIDQGVVQGLQTVGECAVNAVLNTTEAVDYDAAQQLMPEIGEAVMSVLEPLGVIGDLGHVMLTRLPPGGIITQHLDEGEYADLFDRFHVCLKGEVGNRFECGEEVLYAKPGQIFWFNHKRVHSVQNLALGEGNERIHLIVDVMAPNFTQLRGVYYQAETYGNLEEAIALMRAHYAEIAHYQDIPLEIDVEAYAKVEAAGQLRRFVVRDCGRMVGYSVFFVRHNHHYRGSLQAWQDVLYLDPAYRRGAVGASLIRFSETRLRAEGVQVVYHHAKRTNRVGELLGRLGYELVDEIYAKRLDKGR